MASVIRGDDNFNSNDVVTALDLLDVGGVSYGENYTELLSSYLTFWNVEQNITGNGAGNYLVLARSDSTSSTPYIGFEGINSSTVEAVKQIKSHRDSGSIDVSIMNNVTFASSSFKFILTATAQAESIFELYVSGNGEFKMKRTYGQGQINVWQIWKVT